jgi:hypothetical protein
VFLPAIIGHVPDNMVHCVLAFLDFLYLAQRSAHTTSSLHQMDSALASFHLYHCVFKDTGTRPNGFGQPCQHSLVHYTDNICLFGALPGLDSSITESKHIKAIKEPWRKLNRNSTVKQMITKNCRLSQMAALQVKFACQAMLAHVEVEGITEDDKIGRPNNIFSADR